MPPDCNLVVLRPIKGEKNDKELTIVRRKNKIDIHQKRNHPKCDALLRLKAHGGVGTAPGPKLAGNRPRAKPANSVHALASMDCGLKLVATLLW
jgi:hypothetical protein